MDDGKVDFLDFFTSMFAVIFGAFGVGQINADAKDAGEGDRAAAKIFSLIGACAVHIDLSPRAPSLTSFGGGGDAGGRGRGGSFKLMYQIIFPVCFAFKVVVRFLSLGADCLFCCHPMIHFFSQFLFPMSIFLGYFVVGFSPF